MTVDSHFRLINTLTAMFGFPKTRVFVTVIALLLLSFFEFCLFDRTSLGHVSCITQCLLQDPCRRLRRDFLRKYLTVFPVIYCQKGLHATCFQDSVIHLLYLFILLSSYYYYHSQSIYV